MTQHENVEAPMLLSFVGRQWDLAAEDPVEIRLFLAAPAGDGSTWWVHSPEAMSGTLLPPMEVKVPLSLDSRDVIRRALENTHRKLSFGT